MRIRSIHPEFWRSEDVAALDWRTRLVFIGLWSYVDDNGVGRDVERLIIADLFPLEEDPRDTLATVSGALATLSLGGQITRYSVAGKPFLHITAWDKWQRIDKPGKARYAPPTCTDAIPRETVATSSRDRRETPAPGEGEKGRRGEGEMEKGRSQPLLPDKSGDSHDHFDDFWDTYGKKSDRIGSQKLWDKALKKTGVTADLLIAAAAAYVLYERTHNQGGRYRSP